STTTHPIGLTDSTSAVQSAARTATDPIGLTDSASMVQANVRAPADPIGITDSATAVRGLTAAPVDGVGITDSVTAIITDVYAGEWQYIYVPWGTEQFTIPDLTPGMPYDLQIRAMDASGNASPWSDSEQLYGALDTVPPSTPAAPTVVSSKLALQVISTLGKASGGTYNLESDLALLEVHASGSSGFTPTSATKIGTMAADKGIMLAATPAIETFKVDAVTLQYVRVIAIDKTGNRSPASATATATPGLLDSAYISELTATKISAGTLSADIIVGARIKTANSGARVELNTAGLQAFNTGGTQTVGISSADGSAFFEGTVRTGNAGTRIIMQPDVGQPTIRFYPSSGTNYAFINAIDATTAANLGMNSSSFGTSPNDYQHRVYLTSVGATMETFKPVVQTQRGGKIQTTTTGVAASYNYDGTAGGTLDVSDGISRIGVRNTGDTAWQSYVQAGSDGNLRLLGKFPNGSAQFSTSALVTGGFGVGSGFSGAGVGYGFTMASSMGPLYSLNGTPHFPHCISSTDATGFDVAWGPTEGTSTYTAKTLWYWAFRF
ncbi:MAG TPA: fibronectin type III domain-containing protein, partial [Microbacterium sp.]|nr:fibronectin type III domain-containing protein [Microbacterium sp.]